MRKIIVPLLLLFSTVAFAASFDCTKAERAIEKQICKNKLISNLDKKMASTFKVLVAKSRNPRALIVDQRHWINNNRDKCIDETCLESAYRLRISYLTEMAEKQNECRFEEVALLGTWVVHGEGEFEEMHFSIEGNRRNFISWLHHRPELSGMWDVRNCQLHVYRNAEPNISYTFNIKKYSNSELRLQEIGSKATSVYKKR